MVHSTSRRERKTKSITRPFEVWVILIIPDPPLWWRRKCECVELVLWLRTDKRFSKFGWGVEVDVKVNRWSRWEGTMWATARVRWAESLFLRGSLRVLFLHWLIQVTSGFGSVVVVRPGSVQVLTLVVGLIGDRLRKYNFTFKLKLKHMPVISLLVLWYTRLETVHLKGLLTCFP